MNIKKLVKRIISKIQCKLNPIKYAKSIGVKMGGYKDICP